MKKTALLIGLSVVLIGLISLPVFFFVTRDSGGAEVSNLLTRYIFDRVQKRWVAMTISTPVAPNPDGSTPKGSNTIEVFLEEDEPIKAIVVAEALIIGGEEPLLEIAGRSGGDIRICKLILKKVEAERLEVKNTEVVKVDIFNTVAEDDELDVEIEPVNVVRCGRGATNVLSVGVDRKDLDVGIFDDDSGGSALNILSLLGKDKESGIRVDRIRVLGPDGKTGFVENLIVLRTSVFGEIEVRDVKIQHVVLDGVSLDDFSSAP